MSIDDLCIGICQIDEFTGYCIGCGRHSDEIYGIDNIGESAPTEINKPDRPESSQMIKK